MCQFFPHRVLDTESLCTPFSARFKVQLRNVLAAPAVTKVPASVLDEDVADMFRAHIPPIFSLCYDRDWVDLADTPSPDIHCHQVLFIGGDVALPPSMSAGMDRIVPHLTRHLVKEASHWVTVEAHEEVNQLILAWLANVVLPRSTAQL
ncbi:hypothetical protein DYB31_015852 [Aphanomyces astaci]|uniref:AB hydrolase-1 domain-containing protein n=1 Tax=Aphanomyces astaci TaxID=112090 RepID=A0A397FEN5_APHAT|nr:hypothetical protein DYB31_015852 [Aphanomyces astaci]